MKRLLTVFIFLLCTYTFAQTCVPVGGVQCTSNLNLWEPPYGYQNWNTVLNANWSILDSTSAMYPKLHSANVFYLNQTMPSLTLTGSGCGSGTFAKADGTGCGPGGGSGGVSSINSNTGAFTFSGPSVSCVGTTCTFTGSGSGIGSIIWTIPSWLTASPSTISASGTQTFSPTTGQTSHQVIGTCNTATTFGPCTLVVGDLPTIPNTQISGLGTASTYAYTYFQAALTNPVTGPGSGVTVGHLALMGNTSGTLITDGGPVPSGGGSSIPNIIYDDDCTNDPDCPVNTMPLLGRLVSTNQVNLLAIINNNSNIYAAPAMHILAAFNGMGNVPMGAWLGAVPSTNTSGNTSSWTGPLTAQFSPGDTRSNYPDCVTVYRTTLAAAPLLSVKIVSSGFLTCLNGLMQSTADGISSLTGEQLIQSRVVELDVMGGMEPSTGAAEFNFQQDAVSANYTLANWISQNGYPPVYFSGYNNGATSVISGIPSSYPITDPSAYVGSLVGYTRPSWDSLVLYQAVYGYSGLSTVSPNGTNTASASSGVNTFLTSTSSGHYYLTLSQSTTYYQHLLNAAIVSQGSDGFKVSTVNNLSGDITLAAGGSTGISISGKIITISSSGGGGGGGFSPYPPTLSQPVSTNFTHQNFTGAAVYDKTSRMVLAYSGSGNAYLLSNTDLPSTPYTIDLAGSLNVPTASNYENFSLFLRDGTGGGILYFSVGNRSGLTGIELDEFTNYSTYSSTPFNENSSTINGGLYFLRITNDGTNVTYYVSNNGLDYAQVYQQASGTFITPTQVGIAVQSNGTQQVFTLYNYIVTNSILPVIGN